MPSQQLQPETTTSQRKSSWDYLQEEILYASDVDAGVLSNVTRLAGMILLEAAM